MHALWPQEAIGEILRNHMAWISRHTKATIVFTAGLVIKRGTSRLPSMPAPAAIWALRVTKTLLGVCFLSAVGRTSIPRDCFNRLKC